MKVGLALYLLFLFTTLNGAP